MTPMRAYGPKRTWPTAPHMSAFGGKADTQCRRCSGATSNVYWYGVQFVSYHKSMNEIDWNEKVKEALDRTEFMAISTIDAGGSWTCPVQFGHSEKLELYFRSMYHSKHMRHLLIDNLFYVVLYKYVIYTFSLV